MIYHTLLSQFLEVRVGDYIEKLSWLISLVMNGIPLIISSMLLTLILELVFLILNNPHLASTQLKKPVFQIIEEEGPQIWDMLFDGACSKEAVGASVALVSPTQECNQFKLKDEIGQDSIV